MSKKKIRVAVALCNNLLSIGICRLLDDDTSIEVLKVLESGMEHTQDSFRSLKDFIVLTDLPTLFNMFPSPPDNVQDWPAIILLDTNCGNDNIIMAILKKKVCGVLPCNADRELLSKSIIGVDKGEVWIDNKTVKNIIDGVSAMRSNVADVLTSREKEILELIGQGYRNKEVANKLHICEATVKTHLYRIFKKLNVRTRSELVALSINNKPWTTP